LEIFISSTKVCHSKGRANKGLKQTIGTWAKKTGLEYNLGRLYGQNNVGTLKYKIANKVKVKIKKWMRIKIPV